jgi:serine/threonine protein kinase
LSPLAAGTTLCDGRYRLGSVVGRGGMAIVWRATDEQLERDVAIKIIADVLADDPRFLARFEREARLAASLNHPNLVKVFDFSVGSERPFLVMEYVAGGTLAEARDRALDVQALARQLLDALAHIHGAGILHRDVKPANVLLDADGAPRLTDFGIARGDETTGLTQTGQVLGTLRYIAPEVAAGEPATPQSDLYSLGVLLDELGGPRSDALARLIERMKSRDPETRPRSAPEALAELEPTAMLSAEPPTARIPSPTTGSLTPFTDASVTPEGGQTPASGGGIRRPHLLVGAVALVLLIAVVIALASGGGNEQVDKAIRASRSARPTPAGAPVDRQLDRLETIVRGLPRRD